MKINSTDFRVREGHEVDLKKWPTKMLWALARMANGDGSSGHHRDDFTVARVAALSIVYRTENSDRKKLQVSDFIQTSVSHRT